MVTLDAYVAAHLSQLSFEDQALYKTAWQEMESARAAHVEGQDTTRLVAAGAQLHRLCVSLQSALAAEADSGSDHDTMDCAFDPVGGRWHGSKVSYFFLVSLK